MYMYIHMYMYSASTKLEYQVETLCLALYCLAGGKAHVIALKNTRLRIWYHGVVEPRHTVHVCQDSRATCTCTVHVYRALLRKNEKGKKEKDRILQQPQWLRQI